MWGSRRRETVSTSQPWGRPTRRVAGCHSAGVWTFAVSRAIPIHSTSRDNGKPLGRQESSRGFFYACDLDCRIRLLSDCTQPSKRSPATPPTVIPARAGLQSNTQCKALNTSIESFKDAL